LTQVVEISRFETLEALAVFVMDALFPTLGQLLGTRSGWLVRLRIEKPLAVVYADAPAIEICRMAEELEWRQSDDAGMARDPTLNIVRPYFTSSNGEDPKKAVSCTNMTCPVHT